MRSTKREEAGGGQPGRREFLTLAGIASVAPLTASAREKERPGPEDAEGRQTILAIGAHYDDCVFGVPGVLLLAAEKGHRVVILSLIGNYANWKPVGGRSQELVEGTRRVCGDYGIEARFLDFASAGIAGNAESVARTVAEIQPETAFMLWPQDQHPDHEAASRLSHLALRLGAEVLPGRSFRPPRRIYLYDNGPRHTVGFEPNTYVDITPVWGRVLEWLGRVVSLVGDGGRGRVESARRAKETLARYRGSACGVRVAEALVSAEAYPQHIF